MISEEFYSNNFTRDGKPAGGCASGIGFAMTWQDGPILEKGRNGAFVETVLAACRERLEFYQESEFACNENAIAIASIAEAINILDSRTRNRQARGVEGTNQI